MVATGGQGGHEEDGPESAAASEGARSPLDRPAFVGMWGEPCEAGDLAARQSAKSWHCTEQRPCCDGADARDCAENICCTRKVVRVCDEVGDALVNRSDLALHGGNSVGDDVAQCRTCWGLQPVLFGNKTVDPIALSVLATVWMRWVLVA